MSTTIRLSERVAKMTPSATIAVKVVADKLKAKGIDIIDFGPGEPDFDSPENVRAAAHRAIDENLSHYLPPRGLLRLREALVESYRARDGAGHGVDDVIVGCGAKSVLYLAAMALLSPGEEVIIPAPYWVSFPEQVKLAQGVAVIQPTSESDAFIPRASVTAGLLTPKTRAIILCSPSNPTGSVIPQDEIDRFADLARERGLLLIYDETYEHFLYDGSTHGSPLRSPAGVADRTLVVNSVSKSYAMTGYRVGYGLGPGHLIKAMAAIQSHDATHTCAVAQAAAAEAIAGPQDSIRAMMKEYAGRREVIVKGMDEIPGITCQPPQGAFYIFPNVTGLYGRFGVGDSSEVARALLEKAKVAAVPGEAFGAPGHLRFSYALSTDRIREGLERIRAAVG